MAPFSDVDLLFLTPYKLSSRNESVIEATLYTLWDLRLKVGHATRGVEECLRAARGDMTIRTALLENRPICGDADLAIQLRDRLWEGLFSTTAEQFVTAKLLERDERHRRTGGSRYLLEPNVKESKGGLRDVQTLLWLAKYIYRAELWRDLIDKRVFTAEEVSRCRLAKAHLWTVRCGLHYLAGRAQEKLTFDYQVDLAERFGYRASGGQRPVERFMKRYFIAAKQVGDLTRIFCAALEHQHRKAPPLTGLRRYFMTTPPEIERTPWLEIRDGRVAVSDQAAFDADPINLLKIVEIGVSTNLFVHPDALRLMARRVREIDDDVRAREDVRALFVKLVSESADPVRALRRLSETGVLQRLIPEFQRVTGMMQFNMYHHFTVDEHLIQTVEQHQLLKTGALADRHPGESQLVESVSEQRVLAVAALLHDIGKGLREDHSTAGARLAAGICADLGMSEAETHTISWLVLHHLAMSDMAQKRDISDPRTVRAFADLVRSPVRLKLLYALTICDIRAVGPGVWNSWKAQLLRQLYNDARAMLIGEDPALTRHERAEAAQAAAHERAAESSEEAWAAHVARLPASYWIGLDAETHIAHARMMADPQPAADSLRMDVRQEPGRDATEVSFYTADHPGLFARITGALALAGASVVECRATTTRDGMAINSFWVQEPADDDTSAPSAYDDPDRLS
ncbi:MAG: [protein-PII] uridylyltransferase, partial [Pseudomonadota bacterium]